MFAGLLLVRNIAGLSNDTYQRSERGENHSQVCVPIAERQSDATAHWNLKLNSETGKKFFIKLYFQNRYSWRSMTNMKSSFNHDQRKLLQSKSHQSDAEGFDEGLITNENHSRFSCCKG